MNKKFHLLTVAASLFLIADVAGAKDDQDKGRDQNPGRESRETRREERREERQEKRQERQELRQSQKGGDERQELRQPQKGSDEWQRQINDQQPQKDQRDRQRGGQGQQLLPGGQPGRAPQDLNRDNSVPSRGNNLNEGGLRQGKRADSRDSQTIPSRDLRDRPGERDKGERKQAERLSRERVKERENYWKERGKNVRVRFSDYRRRDHIFDDDFWHRFRGRYKHWYFDNRFSWSVEASWPNLVVWLPWKWNRPIYYYYGPNGVIYYSETPDFTYLVPVDSNLKFIAEAVRLANTPQPLSTDQSNWMPLGMYALSTDADSNEMPNEYLSLAVSKGGAISGAYINVRNNEMLEIRGAVDPKSQRVAWKFVDKDWPIMESGMFNLTKEESTLLVHTSSHRTEPRVIVRVK